MSTTVLPPNASRTPRWLLPQPTADLSETERARSRRAAPLFQYVTEPGVFYGQNNLFLSTRRLPVDRSLVAKALNPSLFRRACRMATAMPVLSLISRNSAKQSGMVSPELRAPSDTCPEAGWHYSLFPLRRLSSSRENRLA